MKTKIEIKNRWNGTILFEFECETLWDCLKEALEDGANLRDANLSDANLRDANLRDADLRGANLNGADLRGADLRGANLNGADLRGADLRDAKLRGADLNGADLRGADLRDAKLRGADLNGADLRGADLNGADLRDANLRGAKSNYNTIGISINCPEEGEFIAFKKCQNKIVKIKVLADAFRSSATSTKCRCSKALVLEIEDGLTEIKSNYDEKFIYKVGKVAEVNDFDMNRWNECSTGIHFFMNRENAKKYI